MWTMESLPPTRKSIILLLNLLHQNPRPKEVNITILDVPEDDDDINQNGGVDVDSAESSPQSLFYPEISYAKIETHLGIHAPHLPMLARDFRSEYFLLRRLSLSCIVDENCDKTDCFLALSSRILNATTCLLLVCPDHSTAWADRRRALLSLYNDDDDDDDDYCWKKELEFLDLLFTQHSKAPSSWGHRKWISQKLIDSINRIKITETTKLHNLYLWANSEITTCSLVSEKFPKNYYAWTHRRWVCRHVFQLWYNQPHHPDPETIHNLSKQTNLLFQLLEKELAATQTWMKTHISDHSAVHYQGQIMRMLLAVGLHPSQGFYYLCNTEQLKSLECNSGIKWAWNLVNQLMNLARNSNYLSHEVTWIQRRLCALMCINLLGGFISGDGVGKQWSVRFDSASLSDFFDALVRTEIIDLQKAYSSDIRSSTEKRHALAYVVWVGRQLGGSNTSKMEDLVRESIRDAMNLLGQEKSLVSNTWRVMTMRADMQ